MWNEVLPWHPNKTTHKPRKDVTFMAAFQKINSGIPTMDQALNYIRLGDNVVWQVDDLEVFKAFVQPFVKQAIADKRNLIYIHKNLL